MSIAEPALQPERPRAFRVAELNRAVRVALEADYSDVWVHGELSDVTRAASGHVYFTVNDGEQPACLKAVMFRSDVRRAKAKLDNGELVVLRGGLSLYEPRGTFQLMVNTALPAGLGDIRAELERLRKKLEAEGLLDPARKRPLPRLPRVVGVVTSTSGAALHDIVRVAAGRCPVRIVVAHCLVQGAEAPASIVAALTAVQRLPDLDVVIVGRGGGAMEDLVAFNDEGVARAIAACRVPTVSAVGHEIDVTIADLVADVRAATPSNAAELVVPDRRALVAEVDASLRALARAMEVRIGRERLRLERHRQRIRDPRRVLVGMRHRVQALGTALERAARRQAARDRATLTPLQSRLAALHPRRKVAVDRAVFDRLVSRLRAQAGTMLAGRRAVLGRETGRLDALSPLAILARGYAIALHGATGRALVRGTDAVPGDHITVVLHEGTLGALVQSATRPGGADSTTGGRQCQ